MDWTCGKNGSGEDIKKIYLRVNRRKLEGEELD
jgi:hypothetical protein